jgi:hypothetical protein
VASTKHNFVPLLDTDLLILFLSKCQVPFTHPSFTPAKKKKLGKEMWNAGVLPCMVGISNKDSKGQTDLNGYGELSSPV